MALSDAAGSGDSLRALRELRDDLAGRMEACSSDQNYAVMGRLFTDVLKQIELAEKAAPEKAGTAVDELKRRRESAGLPDATGKARAAGASVRR